MGTSVRAVGIPAEIRSGNPRHTRKMRYHNFLDVHILTIIYVRYRKIPFLWSLYS